MESRRPAFLLAVVIGAAAACRNAASPDPDGGSGGGGGAGGGGACENKFVPVLASVDWAAMACGWAAGPKMDDGVFFVGGRTQVPAILKLSRAGWSRADVTLKNVARPELLWWVHGFSPTSMFAVGDKGSALYYGRDIEHPELAWRTSATATDATLSGVWGASADDVWAVGGYPGASLEKGIIIHYNGVTWLATKFEEGDPEIVGDCTTKVSSVLSSRQLVTKNNLFKVWGTGAEDVWAVGTGGLILHHERRPGARGPRWYCGGVDPKVSFTTVYGRGAKDVWAVGNAGPLGALWHYDGAVWKDVPLPGDVPPLLGVWADADQVIVVGGSGAALRAGPGGDGWKWLETGTTDSIHFVFRVGNDVFAAGGNLQEPAILRHGFVLALCPSGPIPGPPVGNTDGGLDAVLPPEKGKGETEAGERCEMNDDCKPGLECIWVYGGPICTRRCGAGCGPSPPKGCGDPDCSTGFGNNPCCTASSLAGGDLVCAPADHCPPDW